MLSKCTGCLLISRDLTINITNYFIFLVAVNSSGEPAFISLAGANRHLTIEDITAAETVIRSCPVMVCDKGIPLKIAAAALQYGKKLGSRTLFNPSPKLESIPQAVYTNTDVLVLNREEGESLTEISANDFEGTKQVIVKLHQQGALHVVLTLGSQGAIASELTQENKSEFLERTSFPFRWCSNLAPACF